MASTALASSVPSLDTREVQRQILSSSYVAEVGDGDGADDFADAVVPVPTQPAAVQKDADWSAFLKALPSGPDFGNNAVIVADAQSADDKAVTVVQLVDSRVQDWLRVAPRSVLEIVRLLLSSNSRTHTSSG